MAAGTGHAGLLESALWACAALPGVCCGKWQPWSPMAVSRVVSCSHAGSPHLFTAVTQPSGKRPQCLGSGTPCLWLPWAGLLLTPPCGPHHLLLTPPCGPHHLLLAPGQRPLF